MSGVRAGEALYRGSLGTVCDDVWNAIDTHEDQAAGLWLGGPSRCTVWSGLGPLVLDDMRRSGPESCLWSCPHRGGTYTNCKHGRMQVSSAQVGHQDGRASFWGQVTHLKRERSQV